MATENPRVAAYPPPYVYERLVEFKRSQGLKSDSAAIVAILETYFFGSIPNVLPSELSGNPKRIEDLEVKVSSLLEDVALLKQAMSQYTRLSSGELLLANEARHQSDNYEHLSEPPNKSDNTTFDLTNESVLTSANTFISELQTTGADGDTQLVKSSVRETAPVNSELVSESLLDVPTGESILNYPLVEENTPTNGELISERLESTPDFVKTAEVIEKELGDTYVAIDESLASFNQLVVPKQTSTCEAKEFSVEFSLSEHKGEPTRVNILEKSEGTENLTSEPLSDSLSGLSLAEENNHRQVPSVNSEPLKCPSSLLQSDENLNSLKVPLHLTGAALARRLNVSPSTIRHKKNSRNFGQWTSLHDPDGIAWYFDGQKFIEKTSPDIQ
ncbi:hypothetical protein WA1_03920 [Scytonema hofmannii PCC 7110]|uniref:Uncharacterized protein n=1 Tax=Scytonema hofmannii PCC 7110 TaxID=128403 RepID=A0A139X4I6_9CYAN|nr:hypothetical protein [Scytonema hofmannii]KYC39586.1 hypothetical protein WA1_03920 [Scytonema hofmannii PCC 7110]